ncbi:serine hydrolase [Thalassoporum mexicanum]|uniref:serine hydrolase n=1 Tax=Thalassoporum mexicanum TaxID=3457544 RepID=UPI0030DD9244
MGLAATVFLGVLGLLPVRTAPNPLVSASDRSIMIGQPTYAIAPPRQPQKNKNQVKSKSPDSSPVISKTDQVATTAEHNPVPNENEAGQLLISMGLSLVTEDTIPNHYQDLISSQLQIFWQRSLLAISSLTQPAKPKLVINTTIPVVHNSVFLNQAVYDWEIGRSGFLIPIAQQSGLSANATITVCRVYGSCRRMNGDRLMPDPASLIKVPVAVALMQKLNEQNIGLSTKIKVDAGNFTEDRLGTISYGQEYTLHTLLTEMIASSSNIATNQLIDYLGSDYINQVLQQRGFADSEVNFKLMGDQIMPANPGKSRNQLTSDELTQMMVQIYRQEHAGDRVLAKSLRLQRDRALGFDGVKKAKAARWVGEKTGQTSKALGTTVALEVKGRPYVITVVDSTGSDAAISQCVTLIANHIADRGHL